MYRGSHRTPTDKRLEAMKLYTLQETTKKVVTIGKTSHEVDLMIYKSDDGVAALYVHPTREWCMGLSSPETTAPREDCAKMGDAYFLAAMMVPPEPDATTVVVQTLLIP